MASGIGSDVGFFLTPPAGWCTGRGEIVEPLALGRPLDLVIVKPEVGLSTPEVYRRLRVPEHRVTQELLALLGQPLLATTLIAPGESEPMNDPHEIRERFQKSLQAVVDAGACPMAPTTVVDLTGAAPVLLRRGRGDPAALGLTTVG